ncbi:DUF922 domain-containing protein [Sphingomonas sp. G-3-2-10]|uniref:DUF922 domain-containing protein n=1 Tax=Sphingomonas sp. G-3-2-10 TaxID=2728838 RepID=UPI00146CE814|nr:DUF922 domain-containing protein [Sphingomonas sp. G-3-2-10]NML04420.1 DUF922 domain-containing Zn-dependent protease [Sphingomonas sp. G-3-2-10]
MGTMPVRLDTIDRFAKRGLWMCLLWPMLAAPAPLFGPPAMPPELRNVGSVEIQEFDVTGVTLGEIRQSVEDNLIESPGIDDLALATTRSRLEWDWNSTTTSDGGCRIGTPVADLDFRVLLPRLISTGQSPEVLDRWKRYRRGLEMHEARHVHITLDYARRIRQAATGLECTEAAKVVAQLEREATLAHDAFDDQVCAAWNRGDTGQSARDECTEVYLEPDPPRRVAAPMPDAVAR